MKPKGNGDGDVWYLVIPDLQLVRNAVEAERQWRRVDRKLVAYAFRIVRNAVEAERQWRLFILSFR